MLQTFPFNLVAGDQIVAVVAARNLNGWGPFSSKTPLGALIQTYPQKMQVPARLSTTTTTSLFVEWTPLNVPENGYSTVLSYNLQWDMGTGGTTWYNLIGFDTLNLATTFQSVNRLTAGDWY